MKIESILKRKPSRFPVIDPCANIQDIINRMVQENIPEAPVIYLNRLLGLINRGLLFDNVMHERKVGDPVLSVIRKDIFVANPEDDVKRVIDVLGEDQIVVPVLSGERYLNTLHREDLLRALLSEKEEAINNFQCYISGFGIAN